MPFCLQGVQIQPCSVLFLEPPICRRLVMGSPKLTAAARAVLVRVIVCFMCSHSRRSYLAPSSSNYSSLLSFDSIHLKDWEKLRRIILASAKGFTIGAGLKGGLALFSILARFATKKDTRLPEEGGRGNKQGSNLFGFKEHIEIRLFSWNLFRNIRG